MSLAKIRELQDRARQKEEFAVHVTVTKEAADWLLQHKQTTNRKIKPYKISRYVKELRDGTWNHRATQNPFRLDRDGKLAGGQHRCTAISKTGIPMRVIITCDDGSHKGVDDNWALAERLDISRDVATAATLCSAIFRKGKLGGRFDLSQLGKGGGHTVTSDDELADLVNEHRQRLEDATLWVSRNRHLLTRKGAVAAFHVVTHIINESAAERFWTLLAEGGISGRPMPLNHPVNSLRNEARKLRPDTDVLEIVTWLSSAWNSYMHGRSRAIFKIFRDDNGRIRPPQPEERWNATTREFEDSV